MNEYKSVVLCILDGWGQRDATEGNAPLTAKTPNFDNIMASSATSELVTPVSYTHLTLPTKA